MGADDGSPLAPNWAARGRRAPRPSRRRAPRGGRARDDQPRRGLVTHAGQADLAAGHQALHERYEQAEAERAAATASGDPARIAKARRVRDEASATCDRVGRTLRGELAGLARTGFERTGELLAKIRTAWRAEDSAREALRRGTRDAGPLDGNAGGRGERVMPNVVALRPAGDVGAAAREVMVAAHRHLDRCTLSANM
ncbi:hypothetical protein ACU635_31550 [[Actinomadura] parvosata]|uniref:hypothetical protein n=1 Tax=[Actinomadura] parvosata TaxID=1955412 RepID=UPI00406C1D69